MQRLETRSSLSSSKKNQRRDQQRDHEFSYPRIPENKNSPPTRSSTEGEDGAEEDDSQEAEPPRTLICGSCHQAAGPMLACTQGHLFCQQCVRRDTVCSGCSVCGAELATLTPSCSRISRTCILPSGDPRSVETVKSRSMSLVQPMPSNSRNSSYEVSRVSGCNYGANGKNFHNVCSSPYEDQGQNVTASWPSNNERQLRSCCSIVTRGTDESSYMRETNVAFVQAECSRRPIRCPRLDCAVNVAFSALTHHFLFDHPEVPILSVAPGVKSTLIVSFSALSCESSRCLALLLVSDKLTGAAKRLFNGSQIHPRYQNRLPLPVLAARLHCSNEQTCDDENYANGDGQEQGDVVIAWVAGLDVSSTATTGTLCCSIQVVDGTDNDATRSLTYTGPVNSLRTAQDPRQVFATGDCVILHQGFINHVTAGSASLHVNVIVY